jgi:hypothetical protein
LLKKFRFAAVLFSKDKLGEFCSGEVSDSEFADIIYAAISEWGISEEDFREMFGLTLGAVDKWASSQNLPLASVRPKIVKWIYDQI